MQKQMHKEISPGIIRFFVDANCYLIGKDMMIDCSSTNYRNELATLIKKFTSPENIKTVILTHLHYDHIGNHSLFPNAQFFATEYAVKNITIGKQKLGMILDPSTSSNFNVRLQDIRSNNMITEMFDIIETPGHTEPSICLYHKKSNVFFTGDTFFRTGIYGRTDLPLSDDNKMHISLKLVDEIIKKHNPVMAPGHDY